MTPPPSPPTPPPREMESEPHGRLLSSPLLCTTTPPFSERLRQQELRVQNPRTVENCSKMIEPHLVRIFLEKRMKSDRLEPEAHLQMILVHGLPCGADEIFLTSVFLPFDETSVCAVESDGCSGIVMLHHSDSVADALRDSDGWFESLGLQLSPVSGSLLGKSHEMVCPDNVMKRTLALQDDWEAILMGSQQEIFEWDELWEDADDKEYRQNIKGSHKTMLRKTFDQAGLAQGTRKQLYANDEREESWAHEISQQLLSLPCKLQLEVMVEVMKKLGCDSLGELQNKLDPANSEHISLDIERLAKKMPGDNVNSRPEEGARNKWGMWRSLLCNVVASALGHALLFVLSKKLSSGGTETNEAVEKPEITRKDRMRWLLEKVIAPFSLSVVLSFLRVKVISAEEKHVAQLYTNNGVANLMINSGSKIMYFAIKEYPGLLASLGWLAHLASFLVDLFGAIFLWWRGGYHDQDIPDA